MSEETEPATRDEARAQIHGAAYARAALRRAIQLASRGALAQARREVRAALAQAPDDPTALVAAGILLFVTRDYAEALEALQRAVERGGSTRVLWLIRDRAARLGWEHEALAALRAGAAAEPRDPRWTVAMIALLSRRKAWELAWREGARLQEIETEVPAAWMELAHVAAMRGDAAGVEACVERALRRTRSSPYLQEAARVERAVGRWDAARAHLLDALRLDPRDPAPRAAIAELALWAGDHETAAEQARHILARGPHPGSERILGVLAGLEGRRDEARARLERASTADPRDAEALVWLSEVALHEGRLDDAHALLSRAVAAAGGDLFVAQLVRLRLKLEEPSAEVRAHLTGHLLPSLRALCPEHGATLEGAEREAWRSMLDVALTRLHGNRSKIATYLEGARLRLVPHARDPRLESRRIIERLRVEDPDALIGELEALAREVSSSSLPLAHAGELQLWLGRYEEARATLERALAHTEGTRWAWIGLTLLDVLAGEPARALETSARGVAVMLGTEGPAVFVHRGEARRALGQHGEAAADLERAVELNRDRVGAWVNLALVRLATGEVGRAREATQEVLELAPSLLSDAARELGLELFGDAGGDAIALEPEPLRALLEHALTAMRGNRSSSSTSYVTREGTLRFVHHTRGAAIHARTAEELDLATRVLERGLGELPRPGEQRRGREGRRGAPGAQLPARRASSLSATEIERFVEQGYLALPGCVAVDVVDAWRATVRARVQQDPARWIRCGATRAATFGDFDDPASWPDDVVTLIGESSRPVAEVSPRLWGAICDLLFEERIETRRMSDYAILRVPHLGEPPALEDRRAGWHVDQPSRSMRIDGLVNGLLVIVLLSDVTPEDGPTVIAPESVGMVASALAASPEGADLVDPTMAGEIASRCRTLVECTGRAGDVFLVNPLMVHCGSVNVGPRLRWITNPSFLVRAPLDPLGRRGEPLSAVERNIARALERAP